MENVIRELARIGTGDEFIALCRPEILSDLPPTVRRIETDIPQYSIRVFTELPRILRREKPDLVHFPYFFHPSLFLGAPYVVTIFDTAYSYFPGSLSRKERLAYQLMMRRSIRKAALVLTDSHSAKRDIIRFFNGDEAKIRVIPLGVEERFRPMDDDAAFRARLGLPDRYILYMGNHRPHKNLPVLVNAFARIRRDIPHYLVLPWHPDNDCRQTEDAVAEAAIAEQVVFLRDLPDEALPSLYSAAGLFVYPSLYEGFGLPPLEAMASGTPVISSNTSSLPEVVGEAGILLDPHDVEGLAEAILNVLRNPELQQEMREKGIERAKLFTWENTARLTLQAYHEALAL